MGFENDSFKAIFHKIELSGDDNIADIERLCQRWRMKKKKVGEDRYLAPGTKIRRDAFWNDDDQPTSEFGVVVHCWLDEEISAYDCYIAFFGDEVPVGKPTEKPYVLRYAAVGLTELAD